MTIFFCGRREREQQCTNEGCARPALAACVHELGGRKTGQACGRKLCATCAAATGGVCGPHVRMRGAAAARQ